MTNSDHKLVNPRAPRRETFQLGFLFGAIYFVQGIAEPTEGLIAQPVRSLLDRWGHSATEITIFAAIIALPWSIKPLYGLLSDFVPIFGSRRRNYLIATTAATALGLALLYLADLPPGSYWLLMMLLLVPTVGVAFSDVVADALMIEKGQPRRITGTLQSIQWTAMYAATILTGRVGGYLSQHDLQDLGFLICLGFTLCTLILTILGVREPPRAATKVSIRQALVTLLQAARSPTVLGVGGFLFLWNFNPFTSAVLQLHMTREMGFTEQFYGDTVSLMAIGATVGSLSYGFYCRRVPMVWLMHLSIVAGIASTIWYWAMVDHISAIVISLAVGFTYMTASLVQLDLAAQVCPPETAGTVFALLMALSNLSVSLSTAVGGPLYDLGIWLSDGRTSFQILVGIGAALTACCWLLVPYLRRHYGASTDLSL